MPTISLSFPSLLNTPISSYFLPTTTNTTHTSNIPPLDPPSPSPSLPPLDQQQQQQQPPPPSTKAMDAVELMRVFQMFDHNGDGMITMGELRESLTNMGIIIPDSDLTQLIGRIDVNGDGCVDGNEFQALYTLLMEREVDAQSDEEDMKEAFNVFDKNGDGFISVDELRSVLGSLGLNQGRNLEDCKLMIMKVDVDGDGMVSFKEFKKMMKQGGFASLN
ncbi:calmodulin-like protein 3 [Chenopodium quinoa]|uniref:calmodulin-like protein 3 n=1 Tax=Chenopodium quinoa TaxID=63459 RepID=UPI000B76F111|nr:calmodulin-like protein 3 [Chenopodium quinoa]